MKKIILVFMLIILTSCGMIESVGVTNTDHRIEFVSVYKGYFYLEMDDFSCDYNGIEPEKLIDSSEKLNELEKKFGDIITMDVDFDEYLLYINYESDYKSKVKTFDIAELAYNENTFVVLIDYQNEDEYYDACRKTNEIVSDYECSLNYLTDNSDDETVTVKYIK